MRTVSSLIMAVLLLFCGTNCEPDQTERSQGPSPGASSAPNISPEIDSGSASDAETAPVAPTTPQRPFVFDDEGQRIPVTVGAAPGYVPDAACQSCHALLYDDYQHVGMSHSTFRLSADNLIEDFDNSHFYHEASDRHYEMVQRDGAFFQRRYQLDANGTRINEIEASVDLVIGSGNTVRTYATRNRAGEFFQLPLSWYTQTGRWAMSPGFDRPDHGGFMRQVKRECLFCHNAYPEQPAGTDQLGQPFAFPQTLPDGIGCQRCHGPGAEHLRVAYDPDSGLSALRSSIVNPERLTPKLRDDVCYQCHLQPSANPSSFMRIVGRGDYSYQPGEPLEDYVIIVDYQDKEKQRERFEINHHPYRLRQSPCYLESDGTMSCLTCHDPHRKPRPEEKTAYYRNQCLTCHELVDCRAPKKEPHGGDCVGCHMPKHRTEDVIEIAVTDHLIQRNPPREEFLAPRKELDRRRLGPAHPYFQEHVADESTLAFHMSLLDIRQKHVRNLKALREQIEETDPDEIEPYLYLARIQRFLDQYEDAETTYRIALEKNPNVVGIHTGLALVLTRQKRYEEAADAARQAVTLNPASADAYHLLGVALQSLGRTREAGPMFQRVLQLRPYHNDARSNLAKCYEAIGDLPNAIKEHTAVIALNPLDIPAYVDLATILVVLKRQDEALERVRHGIAINPEAFRLHETLGLILALTGQYEQALQSAKKARELGAGEALSSSVEAAVFLHKGDTRRAVSALAKARRRQSTSLLQKMLQDRVRAGLDE